MKTSKKKVPAAIKAQTIISCLEKGMDDPREIQREAYNILKETVSIIYVTVMRRCWKSAKRSVYPKPDSKTEIPINDLKAIVQLVNKYGGVANFQSLLEVLR